METIESLGDTHEQFITYFDDETGLLEHTSLVEVSESILNKYGFRSL